ncbi:MAG: hypothetical protein Q8P18_33760 [Pseudomonadota bacterium]|nr:hypothetical protein [Pseudomonadota bacterium]
MIRIELTEEEAERLHIALQNYIGELGQQISATDLMAFREELKATRDLLRKIDRALAAVPAA